MGWLGSNLVGGVEIRERRKRYPNEPRYKRLDFVRTKKSSNTDEWDLVKVTHPRYVLVDAPYNVPLQYPQLRQLDVQHQQQLLNEFAHHQQMQQWQWQQQRQEQLALEHRHQQHQQQPGPHHHEGHQEQHALPYKEHLAIEAGNHDNDIIRVIGDDDDEEIEYVEARPKVHMPKAKHFRAHSRSRSKGRRKEEVYFSSEESSDDDDDHRRGHRHHRYRSKSRSRPIYDSDDSWARFDRRSRSRSRPRIRPLRGW